MDRRLVSVLSAMTIYAGSISAFAYNAYRKDHSPAPERTVNVCVLNSKELPEDTALVNSDLRAAKEAYRREHNINLVFLPTRTYVDNIDNLVLERGPALHPRAACSPSHDVALLFTAANNIARVKADGIGDMLGGNTDSREGYSVIFGEQPGTPKDEHMYTVQHEIAHLFGYEVGYSFHSSDSSSIMHGMSGTRWTEEDRLALRRKRTKDDLLFKVRKEYSDTIRPARKAGADSAR